jgi:hypothetical protein
LSGDAESRQHKCPPIVKSTPTVQLKSSAEVMLNQEVKLQPSVKSITSLECRPRDELRETSHVFMRIARVRKNKTRRLSHVSMQSHSEDPRSKSSQVIKTSGRLIVDAESQVKTKSEGESRPPDKSNSQIML